MDKMNPKSYEAVRILVRHMDGSSTPEDFQRLESLVRTDPEARRVYFEYIMMAVCMREKKIFTSRQLHDESRRSFDPDLWATLLEEEKNAPVVQLQKTPPPAPVPVPHDHKHTARQINKLSLAAAILSAAALIFIIAYTNVTSLRTIEPVAEVIDTYNAVWQDASQAPRKGSVLYNTDPRQKLLSGLVKVRFNTGAEVIIEGPAFYACKAPDQMTLSRGKAFAHIPLSASGFMINTPASKIIDLGTEFGVEIDDQGNSLVQMYKGKASLIWGRRGNNLQNLTLTENNAAKVTAATSRLETIAYDETAFVRKFDSKQNLSWRGQSLSLADLVGGGNGLTGGSPDTGIRWDNGRFASLDDYYPDRTAAGPTGFIPVRQSPFIEGVFIPNGSNGPIAVADRDTILWDAPVSDGRVCYNVHNSGTLIRNGVKHIQKFDGRLCGTPENPVISMHANAAITFNLEEIRRFYGNAPLTAFTAFCGYSETVLKYAGEKTMADFYVLVDGQERFARADMTPYEQPCPIDIKLAPTDRHLTLITTRGDGDHTSFDWCLFAQPKLHFDK